MESEKVSHLVSGCKMFAQKEYKRRHDNIAKAVTVKLLGDKWYTHKREMIRENERVKIFWDNDTIWLSHEGKKTRYCWVMEKQKSMKIIKIEILIETQKKYLGCYLLTDSL